MTSGTTNFPAKARPLDMALLYATNGWPVFPLHWMEWEDGDEIDPATGTLKKRWFCSCGHSNDADEQRRCRSAAKHPQWHATLLRNGKRDATTDADRIREWWKMWPKANIGICGGTASGLVFIDIDPKNDGFETLTALQEEHGALPETLAVTTGSLGKHYYFQHPEGAELHGASGILGPGIDIKGGDGYVVAPPSLHGQLRRYAFDNPGAPIALLPEWVVRVLRQKGPRKRLQDAAGGQDGGAPRYTPANADEIITQCAWFRHAREDAGTLSEPEWYAMLSILARCEDGDRLAHAWSQPHPGYSEDATARKLAHAREASGPMLCRTISTMVSRHCAECPHRQRDTSPAVLGGAEEVACRNNYLVPLTREEQQEAAAKGKEPKPKSAARSLRSITADLLTATDGWPKSVGKQLFTLEDGRGIRYLSNTPQLFSWIARQMPLGWSVGMDGRRKSFVTKDEFFADIVASAESFESLEVLPHVPPHREFYYHWTPPADYTPDGRHLRALLANFTNVEDRAVDAAIIQAMFLTPAWGGEFNAKPAFAVEALDIGCGKTTLTDILGIIYGGILELRPGQRAEEELLARLLTPAARQQRILRKDNVKGELGGSFFEGLLTNSYLSGKQMYVGEARRPNTLVTVVTGNALRLSADMADRCYLIKLVRPDRDPTWDSRVRGYAREYREEILADIAWTLEQPACHATDAKDRWMAFVHHILVRCPQATPAEVVALTTARRLTHDEGKEEAAGILEALQRLECGTPLETPGWSWYPRASVVSVVMDELKERWISTREVLAMLRRHMEAGHFCGRVKDLKRSGRRGFCVFTDARDDISRDLPAYLQSPDGGGDGGGKADADGQMPMMMDDPFAGVEFGGGECSA